MSGLRTITGAPGSKPVAGAGTPAVRNAVALAAGATTNLDMSLANSYECTFGAGNTTLTFSNLKDGQYYNLVMIQDGVGSRTITWPASVKWVGGSAPTLSTGANKRDVLAFYCDGTNIYEESRALDVR